MQLDEMRQGEEDAVKQGGSEAVGSTKEGNNPYGIWQTAGPRRGWGWGRRTEKPSGNPERNPKTDTCSEEITDGQQIFKHAGRHATRGGRGGRMGGGNLGGRGITSRDEGNTRYEALRMVDENLITDNPNREIVPSKQPTRERGETHTLVPKVLHIPVEPNLTKIPESRPLINLPVDPGEGAMVVAGNSQFPRLSPPRLITSLAGSNQAQAQSQAPGGMLDDDHERLVDRNLRRPFCLEIYVLPLIKCTAAAKITSLRVPEEHQTSVTQ
ncbi:hypothetical protein J5N97_018387 [Dioscorea zingiberensis]|uniref:Uncharacterized protein n=1 Tax=Dioscorea zingiberensis TaxID=325984 RepID=A0A9D5CQ65_9LILI|nr:hypothetical protein J5N97_018387 [Dioscorea zingiberensis]